MFFLDCLVQQVSVHPDPTEFCLTDLLTFTFFLTTKHNLQAYSSKKTKNTHEKVGKGHKCTLHLEYFQSFNLQSDGPLLRYLRY